MGEQRMGSVSAVDEKSGRKFFLDDPDDLQAGEKLTFILNLHGGGSVGMWQHEYFPPTCTRKAIVWSWRRRRLPPRNRREDGWGKLTTSTFRASSAMFLRSTARRTSSRSG